MIKQWINKLLHINKTNAMKKGTVKFFNNAKKFGFIKFTDSDEEIFVHSSNLIDKIKKNDNVTFYVEKGEKGLSAVKVSRV